MQLEQVYYISQLVAAAAIVISIIFLGTEVRRNTAAAKRQSLEESTSHRSDFVRMIASHKDLADEIGQGLAGVRLDSTAWFQFSMFLYAIFIEFELNHRKFKSGDMDADLWEAWMEAYCWWLQFPGVRTWWAQKPAGYTSDFRAVVDTEIEKNRIVDARALNLMGRVGESTSTRSPVKTSPQAPSDEDRKLDEEN